MNIVKPVYSQNLALQFVMFLFCLFFILFNILHMSSQLDSLSVNLTLQKYYIGNISYFISLFNNINNSCNNNYNDPYCAALISTFSFEFLKR